MADFKTLWDNFPDKDELKEKCFNRQATSTAPFDDYCAILMSECLTRSGLSLHGCGGTRCWSHRGERHLLLAQSLATWLDASPPKGFGKAEKIVPATFQADLAGRTGVVFFKDYWRRGGESEKDRSGDHIDLWNKDRITGSSMLYRSIIEWLGIVSDLNKSKSILFWAVR